MPENEKMITISLTVLIKGRAFKVQEQYCYTEIVEILVGCGCGGKKKESVLHYRVVLNDINYDIPVTRAVESTVVIPCEDQNFLDARAEIGDTNRVFDFNDFRTNIDAQQVAISANNIPM
jgi:hypothetical protein